MATIAPTMNPSIGSGIHAIDITDATIAPKAQCLAFIPATTSPLLFIHDLIAKVL